MDPCRRHTHPAQMTDAGVSCGESLYDARVRSALPEAQYGLGGFSAWWCGTACSVEVYSECDVSRQEGLLIVDQTVPKKAGEACREKLDGFVQRNEQWIFKGR